MWFEITRSRLPHKDPLDLFIIKDDINLAGQVKEEALINYVIFSLFFDSLSFL